jgi:hypothetical protein
MGKRLWKAVSLTPLVVGSLLIALALLELGFRLFKPQQNFSVGVCEWHKDLGFRQIPGAKGCFISPEFNCPIQINSKGLRDREYDYRKGEHTKRILCLGDSFTFGYGVSPEEAFPKVLERLLNTDRARHTGWEVINAGVCGSGTAHQLRYFVREGYKYSPDIVLLCICGANDFNDNTMSGLYRLEADSLVSYDARFTFPVGLRHVMQHLPGYRTLFARSHLITFIKRKIGTYAYGRGAGRPRTPAEVAAARQRAIELTKRLLIALDDSCRAVGADLVVVSIPQSDGSDYSGMTLTLVDFLRTSSVTYVELRSRFNDEARRGRVNYYPVDGHWNSEGNSLAAEILSDSLRLTR